MSLYKSNLIAIGGSLRFDSYTYQILKIALQQLEKKEIKSTLLDLRQMKLPFCTGEQEYLSYPDVETFRQQVKSAQGILLATPEYHGSVSGVLKNALDLLDEEHCRGKVVGLIAVAGGVHSTNAINTLRIICRHLHCWVLPEQLVIAQAQQSFDAEGNLIDPALRERLDQLLDHLIEAMQRLGL